MLALQSGTRLIVYDEDSRRDVSVPLGPGDVLVFDGDVAHAGAWYASVNTRVHMYLDVEGVERAKDFTWFARW
jgi:ectoine hydroxylase-related dioxygenase (phytanoyl-CoA dioxygenase family)